VRADLLDRLPEYVLGTLPEGEQAELHAQIAASPELQREVAEMTEALAGTTEGLPSLERSPGARARLVEALAGPHRFLPFFLQLARRLDLTVGAVCRLLARIDDPAAWEASPLPWVKLIHFQGGPRLAGADAGFVRVGAGMPFPRHSHQGPEMSFILEGRMIEPERTYLPGDAVEVTPDVVHAYVVGPESDMVVMVWHHGITLLG